MVSAEQHELSTRNRPPDHHAFPVHSALDFQHVQLSPEELDDVQMVWWLFCGYCPQIDVRPVGTRTELTCMVHIIAQRMRTLGEYAPRVQSEWPLYMRQGVAWACERVQRTVMRDRALFVAETRLGTSPRSLLSEPISDTFSDKGDGLFPFATGPLPHVLLLVYLRPLLSQISEAARLMQPPAAQPLVAALVGKLPPALKTRIVRRVYHHYHPRPPAPTPSEDDAPVVSCCGLIFRGAVSNGSARVTPLGGVRGLRRSALSDVLNALVEERRTRPRYSTTASHSPLTHSSSADLDDTESLRDDSHRSNGS